MLLAAKVLAAACADLMEKPEILAEAKAEFAVTAAEGYDCPLEKYVVAGPQ
jgi:aminobenzoyl-glutamate utilization protein B